MTVNKIKGLLEEIAKTSGVSEVIINGIDNVYVEKSDELIRIDIKLTHEEVHEFCSEIAQYNTSGATKDVKKHEIKVNLSQKIVLEEKKKLLFPFILILLIIIIFFKSFE